MARYRPLFDIDGRVAVVTGAAGILGRRFCHGLAEFGATVCVVDLDRAACEAVARELSEQHPVAAMALPCDVTDPAQVEAVAAAAEAQFGGIDILLNNAASKGRSLDAFFAPIEEFSIETWRDIMAVNLDGMFLMAQAVGRRMLARQKGGSIVQTASIYGIMGPDSRIYEGSHYLGRQINTPAVYSASKAGVIGLTRHLATCWGSEGIRVNSLTPGGVESGQNEVFSQRYSARVPLGRMADGDDLVGAVIYLASDASRYVTGQNLVVDGGLSAW
jgi:NAD(P)-dependent dehydrogenase (short-subunit alcohol dehydrogenase family)